MTAAKRQPPKKAKIAWWSAKAWQRRYKHWRRRPLVKRLAKLARQKRFRRRYLLACLLILGATTLLWSVLSADVQRSNADQLVNAYLFENGDTLHGASFPGSHSFLIKWPLFYAVKLLGFSSASFLIVTVLLAAVTVGFLAYVLWRIERRPIVLGTLYLALAGVLLSVPAQPYAGALLPANLAMLTTRNIEYVLYLLVLLLVVKASRVRSWQLLVASLLLGLLVASDSLFLLLTVGGGLVMLIIYALLQHGKLVTLAARWLVVGLAATLLGLATTSAINQSRITHISPQSIAGPYGAEHGSKALGLGGLYAVGGLLTNFGANPAYDAVTVRQMPAQAGHHLKSFGGPALLVNLAVFALVLTVSLKFVWQSLLKGRESPLEATAAYDLWLLLLWATIAMGGLFMVSKHYYVVDARYLALGLFAGFVGLTAWARNRHWHGDVLLGVAGILLFGIVSGSINAVQTHTTGKRALSTIDGRDQQIAQILNRHHVDVLVGDYWRVVPTKAEFAKHQTVMPLANCSQPRDVLSSLAWQPDLHHHSFAYLLTLHGSLTDYPNCSLQQVDRAYGLPNSSVLIAGSLADPQEMLLFYDNGAHPNPLQFSGVGGSAGTILPVALEDLSHTLCNGPSVMNIVAHQDDDLLFTSPDLLHDIRARHCVRTVYLTAGDAGGAPSYWLSREQGSEAAYAEMLGIDSVWIQRTVTLAPHEFAIIATPKGDNRISLIFLRLPDGNIDGRGFAASNFASLEGLRSGRIKRITSTDGQSNYSAEQLVKALTGLMRIYRPAEIRTQSSLVSLEYPDHSDHWAAGQFATVARAQYEHQQFEAAVTVPLTFYVGYPVHGFPGNVAGNDLAAKEAAFLAYGRFDGGVCRTAAACQDAATYGAYLSRQYPNPY